MPTVSLTCGDIDYIDSGGEGPVAVFTHGVLMSSAIWGQVIDLLSPDVRCIAPTLPLGAHAHAMVPGTDLSIPGLADIVGEFLDRLVLSDVTLVVHDVGAPMQVATHGHPAVKDLVLVACEAFTDLSPGQRGRNLKRFAGIPDGLRAAVALLRAPGAGRVNATFGRMTKRGVPGGMLKAWTSHPLADEGVRTDMRRYLIASSVEDLDAATYRLPEFTGRTMVVWAAQERQLSPELGHRLRDFVPGCRYVEIDDSYTLIPIDQPQRLAEELRGFILG